ncbi:hypothetical protein GQ457_06G012150 [Hibiscus cannabinus]
MGCWRLLGSWLRSLRKKSGASRWQRAEACKGTVGSTRLAECTVKAGRGPSRMLECEAPLPVQQGDLGGWQMRPLGAAMGFLMGVMGFVNGS